jgi:hypothetical protein
MKQINLTGYAFVSHVDNSINPEICIDIEKIYNSKFHLFIDNLKNYGHIKNMGYLYNAKDYLKKYLVKQYGQWSEYYAPNKTLLRKSTFGRIDKIIEIC